MKRILYFALALAAAFSFSVFYYIHNLQPTVVIDGVTWRQVLYWNFKDSFYPNGWGWGNWSIVDGELEGQDLNGAFSVYFFPFTHGGDFVLETKVRFIEGLDDDVEIQLLTRDSEAANG